MISAIAAVLVLGASPLPGGFQSATWGMSQSQTNKALGAELTKGGFYRASVDIAGRRAFAEPVYAENKLAYVTVGFLDGGDFEAIKELLIEKYGEPNTSAEPGGDPLEMLTKGRSVEWDDGTNRVELKQTFMLTLTYASKSLEPAARAAAEARANKKNEEEKARKLKSL